MQRPLIALAIAGAALVAVPAQAGSRRSVGVEDNYYAPSKLTVNPGTTIAWTWPDAGGDVHDVKLTSAPAGVRKFATDPGSAGFVYSRKLTKPGLYKFVCTFHDEMTMSIRVKR